MKLIEKIVVRRNVSLNRLDMLKIVQVIFIATNFTSPAA